ncbi:MAG TPA: LamG domain-containing protein [Candidatus Pacearchaeota archaeon]|nr:LamG domain-containing protein [Candidatus Pacearchaeota archaeon]HQM24584.1 LamG domain-containing protein [Candidatus Pacearchaeota archaeon]
MSKSFTLIEILIVIVVIGILSSFILVGMNSIASSANIAKSESFSNSLRSSLLMSLVSEWKLDESNGQNIYDSWNSNSGRLGSTSGVDASDPTWTTNGCAKGSCLSFDGTDDYVYLNAFGLSGSKLTFEFWLKNSQQSYHQTILGDGSQSNTVGYIFIYRESGGGNIVFQFADGTSWRTTSSSFFAGADNILVHLTITADYTNRILKFYKNGIFISEPPISYPMVFPSTSRARYLGAYNSGNFRFNGLIDNVRMYNDIVSSLKIKQNYYSGLNNLIAKGSIDKEEYNNRLIAIK